MKKVLAVSVTCFAAASAQSLPLFDVDLGMGVWSQGVSGNLSAKGSADMDLDDELGIEGDNNGYFYAEIDHPLFILPDFKFRAQGLTASGSALVEQSYEYAGISVEGNQKVKSSLDLSYYDFIANYEFPFPYTDIDLGLNFRYIDGSYSAEAESFGSRDGDISLLVPMIHLAGDVTIPSTDLHLGGEFNGIPLGNSAYVTDYAVYAKYFLPLPTNSLFRIGAELGYHDFSVNIGDNVLGFDAEDYSADLASRGVYFGLAASF